MDVPDADRPESPRPSRASAWFTGIILLALATLLVLRWTGVLPGGGC
jgi:hypothetical protein